MEAMINVKRHSFIEKMAAITAVVTIPGRRVGTMMDYDNVVVSWHMGTGHDCLRIF